MMILSTVLRLSCVAPCLCLAVQARDPRKAERAADDIDFGLSPEESASISREVYGEFPTIDIGDLAATVNSIINDATTAYPSLASLSFSSLSFDPSAKPTAPIFNGPYPSDIAASYSRFTQSRTSGQRFTYQSPFLETRTLTLSPPTTSSPSTTEETTSTSSESGSDSTSESSAAATGASSTVSLVTDAGGQAGATVTAAATEAASSANSPSSATSTGGAIARGSNEWTTLGWLLSGLAVFLGL